MIEIQLLSSSSQFSYPSDSLQSNNQYSVSSASFAAILSLWIKSALLSAFCASLTFAPILVHDFNNCFAITYL